MVQVVKGHDFYWEFGIKKKLTFYFFNKLKKKGRQTRLKINHQKFSDGRNIFVFYKIFDLE